MWSIFKSPRVPKSLRGHEVYDHVLGRRFDPGAEAEVFVPQLNNPVYLFRGNGTLAGSLSVLQHPQAYLGPQAGVSGLGGIQAGQIFGQPLIDPSQLEPEGGE